MRHLFILFLIGILCSTSLLAQKEEQDADPIGQIIKDFSLVNIDNTAFSTAENPNTKGFIIVFTCNHCPFARLYTQRLNDLYRKYAPKGVPMLAINSMDTLIYEDESFAFMKARAEKEKYRFPYLQDAGQEIGKRFGANHTPHAFVIWKEQGNWEIKYSGAIDDNGESPEHATPYIQQAVDALLAGKEVALPVTNSFGCRIFYRE